VQWGGGGPFYRHNNCGGALKVNDIYVCVGGGQRLLQCVNLLSYRGYM
jgi:hypothetical protein